MIILQALEVLYMTIHVEGYTLNFKRMWPNIVQSIVCLGLRSGIQIQIDIASSQKYLAPMAFGPSNACKLLTIVLIFSVSRDTSNRPLSVVTFKILNSNLAKPRENMDRGS